MNTLNNKTATAKFYEEPAMVEEVYTGYLRKSPGQKAFLKSVKSWRCRFFVLYKTDENAYHLTYYTNEKRDKPLGKIDLSKIILMFTGLETHQMRDWIQKQFKCPPSSVLFLRVEDNTQKYSRDYFLIGNNSVHVNGWLNALKTQISNKRRHTFDALEDNRFRSTSEPPNGSEQKVEDQSEERWSAPELMLSPPPTPDHYDYPRKFSEPPVPVERKISDNEEKDEKDGKQDESPEDSNDYMFMASVQKALEDVQQEADTACIQTNTSINGHESSVCNGAVNQDTDDENKRMSIGERHSQPCLLISNGNCVSTELNEAPLNKSVSECRQIQDSCLFHKGDQILAFNDLLIDTVEEIQTYLRRLSKSLHSEIYNVTEIICR